MLIFGLIASMLSLAVRALDWLRCLDWNRNWRLRLDISVLSEVPLLYQGQGYEGF